MLLCVVDAQTPRSFVDYKIRYEMRVHVAVAKEYVAHWQQPMSSATGVMDVAIVIASDGRVSALQVIRNTASDPELRFVLYAIKHAEIPPPPPATLEHGVFHTVIHVASPERPNKALEATADRGSKHDNMTTDHRLRAALAIVGGASACSR